jgi:threonine synthase
LKGKLINHVLGKRGQVANIIIETSGDTGPAAIAGVKGHNNVEIFCLYPFGRVSEVQELQMIAIQDANVHVFRTEGNTDEQASVLKEVFQDLQFVEENNVCSVNSINWFRIVAQSSYYIWSYLQLAGDFGS